MRRMILLSLFLVVSFDFATPDALLVVPGARSIQWDDEEESVPSRRQRVRSERHDTAPSPDRPALVTARHPQVAERALLAEARRPPTAWLVPIRQAHPPSVDSAAPSEDH